MLILATSRVNTPWKPTMAEKCWSATPAAYRDTHCKLRNN